MNTGRGISSEKLSRILADWVLERTSALTDSDLDAAEDSFRGFTTPELASNPPPNLLELGQRKNLHVRASVLIHESRAQGLLKSIRDRAASADPTLKQEAYRFFDDEVTKRLSVLTEAVPGKLGIGAPRHGAFRLTPLQSFLLAYAVVSDDPLAHNQENLNKTMASRWHWATSKGGGYYPPPNGFYAYGRNGYLYSSPLDLFFNETALQSLVTSLDSGRTQ
ncbi:MAG: hypothetical protein ACREDR_07675 [Blastocatellia bacterium]